MGRAPWTRLTWLPILGEATGVASELAASLDAVATPLAEVAVEVLEASTGDAAQVAPALHKKRPALSPPGGRLFSAAQTRPPST